MAKWKRMEDSENKPVAEFRVNAVKAVVWKNESNDKVYYNTTLVRIYTDIHRSASTPTSTGG